MILGTNAILELANNGTVGGLPAGASLKMYRVFSR